jgi:hypothetical protein
MGRRPPLELPASFSNTRLVEMSSEVIPEIVAALNPVIRATSVRDMGPWVFTVLSTAERLMARINFRFPRGCFVTTYFFQ